MEHIRKDHFKVTPIPQSGADYLLPSQPVAIDTVSNTSAGQEQSGGTFERPNPARIDGAIIDSCFDEGVIHFMQNSSLTWIDTASIIFYYCP